MIRRIYSEWRWRLDSEPSRYSFRALLSLFAVGFIAPSVGISATIKGTVRAEGKADVEEQVSGGKYGSRKFKFVERVDYAQLNDFIVYIELPTGEELKPSKKSAQVVIQEDAMFKPYILPIAVGTEIEWPNRDDIYHNVFSYSEPKQFDLGLYKKESKRLTFDKPGRVDVFCSIHKDMQCIILVLESRHFASTSSKGGYIIQNVPAGSYRIRAWHQRLPSQVKEITLAANEVLDVDFTLGVKNLPTY